MWGLTLRLRLVVLLRGARLGDLRGVTGCFGVGELGRVGLFGGFPGFLRSNRLLRMVSLFVNRLELVCSLLRL